MSLIAHGDDGKLIIIGIEPENIERMRKGFPMRISKETHPGYPLDVAIVICVGEPDELYRQIKPHMADGAELVDHRGKG